MAKKKSVLSPRSYSKEPKIKATVYVKAYNSDVNLSPEQEHFSALSMKAARAHARTLPKGTLVEFYRTVTNFIGAAEIK